MKNKALISLLAVSTLLLVIALFINSYKGGGKDISGTILVKGVELDHIAGIEIEQGEKKVTINNTPSGYVVKERDDYPGNAGKIGALILQLMDLKGTEWITSKKEKASRFGVGDDSSTVVKVTMVDEKGGVLGGIMVGDARKVKGDGRGGTPDSSRYIRPSGKDDIFLVSNFKMLSPMPGSWIEEKLLDIKSKEVKSLEIKHTNISDNFIIENKGEDDFKPTSFKTPEGKTLKEYIISSAADAMSGLNSKDVLKVSSPEAEGLSFDYRYISKLKDGRVYEIHSAKKDGRNFIKIEVSFEAASVETTGTAEASSSNIEETVRNDQARFANWIFEMYGIDELTYKKSDLLEASS